MTMPPEPAASRREVDLLREDLHRIDAHGSRGVGVLQNQLTELVKDLTEMKADLSTRFEAHQRVHDQDHADRISGRRWLITTGIAGLAAMGTVIAMLADVLSHLHH